MKRYVIERDVPGIGGMNGAQYKDVAKTSNSALAKLAGKCQWEHSYVVDNKTFCIYRAESEAAVKEHAKLSGFPATKITEVRKMIVGQEGVIDGVLSSRSSDRRSVAVSMSGW